MKKALITASVVAGALGAYAQGQLNWEDDQAGYTIEILSPSLATPTIEVTGQTSYDNPSGSTQYTGGYIGGGSTGGAAGNGPGVGGTPTSGYLGINYENPGNFTAGLYIASSQAALTAAITGGSPVATTSLLGGANDGLYNTIAPTYTSTMAVGTPIWVGIAAWYSANGDSTYAASYLANSVQGYVESDGPVDLGGGTGVPASLAGLGLTSFSLAGTTPEPSTIALGVIGASAFLMRLRRKL